MADGNEIAEVLCGIRDPKQMDRFLSEILTETERRDLSLRWKLMNMLETGMSQREVASALGVSLCKITRGSRVLKKRGSICRALIGRQNAE